MYNVSKDRKRNAKLTTKNKKFVKNGKVDWRCEFCDYSFDTKSQLNKHATDKNCECSKKYYEKYRIQVLFPWNTYGKMSKCKICGIIIQHKAKFCKTCSCRITSNKASVRKSRSECRKGDKHWLRKTGVSHPNKGKSFEEQFGPEKAKKMKENLSRKQTEIMKNGWSAYMNSCIKNPSKPQVELYNITKEIYSDAILNYPCLNFSIDIAIPSLKIAIEYDGSYWHQDNEYDLKRQKLIEEQGWRFLRYVDYVPNLNKLKKDILCLETKDKTF